MAEVIGLDFGNYYSFPSFIMGIDQQTRRGGNACDLLDASQTAGIPSVFFYCASRYNGEERFGRPAEQSMPSKNRVRYMKRNLGRTVQLDNRCYNYDDIITKTVQYCVREANRVMKMNYGTTTNLVSLSYPASYNSSQRRHLISMAEKATLEDGTAVKVCGTIMEPAAAALDYLAESNSTADTMTVMAYDLGGGTFDLSVVTAYPKGKRDADGNCRYYDIRATDGDAHLGGMEFDKLIADFMVKKIGRLRNENETNKLMNLAEGMKRELSEVDTAEMEWYNVQTDESDIFQITRREFDTLAQPLVQKTVKMMRNMLADPNVPTPDMILLTGGASQMPTILNTLKKEFPLYADRIIFHRPSKAISYGAARYGSPEEIRRSAVVQRTTFDIGIRYYSSLEDTEGHIHSMIPAGTAIPFKSEKVQSSTLTETDKSRFEVHEAKVRDADTNQVTRDYQEVMRVYVNHGKKVPKGTPSMSWLEIDERNILHVYSHATATPDKLLTNTFELKNLS